MSVETKYSIVKLNNTNYFVWKFKMQLLLTKEGCWDTVTTDVPDPVNDVWKRKNSLAYATIGLNVEDDQLVHLRGKKTGKEAWEVLQHYHEKSNANSLVRLIKRVMSFKLNEGDNVETHIARVAEAVCVQKVLQQCM